MPNDILYSSSYKGIFPNFSWVLRDFDVGFQHVTAETYIEQTLEEERRISDDIGSKNKVKRNLKHFFPKLDCLLLAKGD